MTNECFKYNKKLTRDKLYSNLSYDWDAELRELHGEELWSLPNENSRKIRRMVVEECMRTADAIKELPFWRRLFNQF